MRFATMLIVLVLLVSACSGSASTPTATAKPTNAPAATVAAKSANTPTAATQSTATAPAKQTAAPTVAPAKPTAAPSPVAAPAANSPFVEARVVRVVDGDTIEVEIDGQKKTVRYIGIDTPETVDPRRPVQAFGKEASAKNKELVESQTVQLEKDVSETDRYGRLLRYVYVGDLMINAELARLGYAQASAYPPDVKYQDIFSELEKEAREAGRGLWASATVPPETPAPVTPTPTPQVGGNCDPAYPDFCIPLPPPDLDCKDISRKRFKVLPPDPHRLDSDRDGIGCES